MYHFCIFGNQDSFSLIIFPPIESPPVTNLTKQINDDGSVTLTWKKPPGFSGKNINARYVVVYNGERHTVSMEETKYTIKSGLKDKSYMVEVRTYLRFF